ncbi:MAG: hypothetical protein WAL98_20505 [Desulfatiglandaceae bacterium]
MRRILLGSIFLVVFSVLFLIFFPGKADAIPAFARKYKTSCMLCHAPFPKLTAMGEAFRLNGYKLPEADEIYVKEQPVSMGADAYKQVFPDAVWPSHIPGVPPLAIRIVGGMQYHPYGPQTNRSDFNFPGEFTLLGAGSFDKNLAFYANLGIEREDDGSYSTNPAGWLMWQNLFSGTIGKHYLNIKAGNVGRHTIALPNTRNENSFTAEDYLYVDAMGLDNEPGLQADGYGRRWRYGVGVVEGNSDNSQKDFYGAFSLKFGGLGYDGSGGKSEAGGVGTSPSGYWRDDSVQVGFFTYRSYIDENAYRFDRIGGDVRVNYKDLSMAGGYITGDNHETHEQTDVWFAEAQYFVFPWMVPYLRYENLTVKHEADGDVARFIVGSAMLVRANIKVNLEGRFYTTNEPAKAAGGKVRDDNQIALVLDWAF